MDGDGFASADLVELHAPFEFARTEPHERDPITVHRVHIGLNLEDEASHRAVVGRYGRGFGRLRARGRGEAGERINQFVNAEILECGTKINRGKIAAAISVSVEISIASRGEFGLFAKSGQASGR